MHGREHQMTGFCGGQREANGFQIAQLADQDEVGVFAQRRAQRFVEAMRVAVHFALVDQAFLRGMYKLDRILDREDMAVLVLVDVVDHRRERSRLARTSRPGHQDQTLRLLDELLEDARAAEILQAEDFGRNRTEHRSGTAVLVERIDAETRQARDLEREVDLEEFLVVATLLVRHDVVDQRVDLLVIEGRDVDPAHVTIDADHRRQAGRQVQVRRLVLHRKRK